MKQNAEMKRKLIDKTFVVTTVVCLLPILFWLAVYGDLPEQVAIHWGVSGQPDGWMSKSIAIWAPSVFLACLNMACHIGSNADPKGEGRPRRLLTLCKWLPAALSIIMNPIVLLIALDHEIPIATVCSSILGLMFLVVGNYLPKCRQNHTLGIKLPWTLRDEENWNKTHRLAGPLYMLSGILLLTCGFFGWLIPGLAAAFLLALVVPTAYSFWLSRTDKG